MSEQVFNLADSESLQLRKHCCCSPTIFFTVSQASMGGQEPNTPDTETIGKRDPQFNSIVPKFGGVEVLDEELPVSVT